MRYWLMGILLSALFACSGGDTKQAENTTPESGTPVAESQPETDSAENAESTGDWMPHYIAIQEALAADDLAVAQKKAQSLADSARGEIKTMAEEAAKSADIETLREAFGKISESIKESALPDGHVLAYCPMAFDNAGAHWVQKEGEIMNPYFGASMLHCGVVRSAANEQ